MVFWSSFAKKVKQVVSQTAFDLLKNRVDKIETNYVDKTTNNTFKSTEKFQTISMQNKQNKDVLRFVVNTNYTYAIIDGGSGSGIYIKNLKNPTSPDNATNKGYVDGLINPLNNKVTAIINGLQNGNIVNYAGEWNSTTNYKLAQAVTYGGDWFVSNQDNNVGHTPSKTSSTYWVYISQPVVDLAPYLTKSEARSTYQTQSEANINYTQIINTLNGLDSSKADLSYLTNNFYNKTYIDNRKVKYQDVTITRVVRTKNLIPGELWIGQFETNFQPSGYDYLVNNIVFYDILFLGAQYKNWKHKITAAYTYTSGSSTRLAIEMLYTEEPTVKIEQNQIVRIWFSEEINR